jgi:hypothetical protein
MESISIAYDLKEFEIMHWIARVSNDRTCGEEKFFYELTELFSRNVISRSDLEKFKNDWSFLNRENRLWEGAVRVNKAYMELFTRMSSVCRFINRRTIRIGTVIKNLKDTKQEKW